MVLPASRLAIACKRSVKWCCINTGDTRATAPTLATMCSVLAVVLRGNSPTKATGVYKK